jgi:hypothetical protein
MRASMVEIFASSMRSFGLIAIAKTGSLEGGRGSSTLCPLDVSTSPVATLSSRPMATMEPGPASVMASCFLPCSRYSPPERTFSSFLEMSVSVASDLSVPESVRTIESFPDCG